MKEENTVVSHPYTQFLQQALHYIPRERIYTDELRRIAWGTDASFYRLIPWLVIRAIDEVEVSYLLRLADYFSLPVTFRAAGTSLSGQAVSDSILIVAGKHWERYSISPDGEQITLQPGIIGQRVNELLAPYGRKFAPDPASVKSAMVGGIVMNNASGMNCGTHANSDRMLLSARIVLADGTILDTGDPDSRAVFHRSHWYFNYRIWELRNAIRENTKLAERIRHKYSIKNVMGLNLLPFLLYDDPFDIITHLIVGSEGTLAFLSEVTMKTEYDYPCKASAMLYFKTIKEACRAVVAMKSLTHDTGEWIVKGAELLDWKSLASVNDPVYLRYKGEVASSILPGVEPGDEMGMTAVLTETKGRTPEELRENITAIEACLSGFETYIPVHFTDRPEEYDRYWAIRSGIFPSVGGTRPPGTTCLIEDVAFHIEDLPEATVELQKLLAWHGYDEACIYGHALEGNFHFILNQSFGDPAEVERYEDLMEDVKTLVVDKYDGSLKAEHGTGRNMAPFVRYEWGDDAYQMMKEVKKLFDPKGLLNPGVIFNDDPECYLKNLKLMPPITVDEVERATEWQLLGTRTGLAIASICPPIEADKCIECGFCEANCVSCGLTLSPRQRIAMQRMISYLTQGNLNKKLRDALVEQYRYLGDQTCAGDGLCSMACPMGINTADLTHLVRREGMLPGSRGYKVGEFAARHFSGIKSSLRPVLGLANLSHSVLGTKAMSALGRGLHNVFHLPQWAPAMPRPYKCTAPSTPPSYEGAGTGGEARDMGGEAVVYFPSCINQTMGLAKRSPVEQPLVDKMLSLLHKAGYRVIFPVNMESLCCGTIWESKGMLDIADRKSAELEAALWQASEQGRYPVLCDQSPCLHRMRQCITKMKLYEPAEFIYTFLRERLVFTPTDRPVALHITCSMRRMGLADTLIALARLCSTRVIVPEEVGCCGFAGNRGFTHPELNAYALRKLRPQIEAAGVSIGYSNSRTCEIGLATHSGIPYVSIAYLVDECTRPIDNENQ